MPQVADRLATSAAGGIPSSVASDQYRGTIQAWIVPRRNRSLATELGIPPRRWWRAISNLRHIAETGSALPALLPRHSRSRKSTLRPVLGGRFCVDLADTRCNRGRVPHDYVLKDITDRREAERRYRELFDSIQEGLFFATPEGQFLDVNDALVRMLGYESAEELLRADVSAHLYPTPAAKARLVSAIAERGPCEITRRLCGRKTAVAAHDAEHQRGARCAGKRGADPRIDAGCDGAENVPVATAAERDFNQKILTQRRA